jgi:GNAT superfamily N-acetyltransferase
MTLTPDLAVQIMMAADQMDALITPEAIDKIEPEQCGEFTFAVERMVHIMEEMKPLHQAHWNETETYSHGLALDPDYQTFLQYERAGRYVLFTLRKDGKLLGNCAMYLCQSTHTQTLLATEDTLYLLPEARKGRTAVRFVSYIERALKQFGVREIKISVKLVNKAGRFFQMVGYKHIENGLSKMLEA